MLLCLGQCGLADGSSSTIAPMPWLKYGRQQHIAHGAKPQMHRPACSVVLSLVILVLLIACTEKPIEGDASPTPENRTAPLETPTDAGTPANVYFGDLHVHTSWSTDAYGFGNRVGPRDAYRFARGEAVKVSNGIITQLATPLDFTAITDHAEGFNAIAACTYENSSQYDSDACKVMRTQRWSDDVFQTLVARAQARPEERDPVLCADVDLCVANAGMTWQRVQAVAEEFNDPGNFTTLIGYEFTPMLQQFGMMHRNVIFRGSEVIPHAISNLDAASTRDLLQKLDTACQLPCRVMTIPHNTNYSWGLTFSRTDEDGAEYQAADLDRRARLERVAEVAQMKGESECHIGVGTSDEDCGFEKMFEPCADGTSGRCATDTSFVRNALLDGLQLAGERGINPFKLGIIGSTDTHGSDPGNTDPRNRFAPARGNAEAVQQLLEREHIVVGKIRRTSAGALAAVWAADNTRAEIWDALHRREAFATSGSRLKVRFFAGALPQDMDNSAAKVAAAYANGVPMGGTLEDIKSAPSFWVSAARDPLGAPLDRVQVIKGWLENGEEQHKVWDVVCADGRTADDSGRCSATAADLDLETCTQRNDVGAAELSARFVDPDFAADQRAFYYIRVLENPSCRWTTWLANSAGVARPNDVPATLQNRAWTSPIWIEP